jgi:hypothetical protein
MSASLTSITTKWIGKKFSVSGVSIYQQFSGQNLGILFLIGLPDVLFPIVRIELWCKTFLKNGYFLDIEVNTRMLTAGPQEQVL